MSTHHTHGQNNNIDNEKSDNNVNESSIVRAHHAPSPSSNPQGSNLQSQEQEQQSQPPAKKSKPCTSDVWNFFTKVTIDGKEHARCNGCQKTYAGGGKSHGTSTLRRHMEACLKLPHYQNLPSMLIDHATKQKSRHLDQRQVRELIAMSIIEHDLPYSFVQYKRIRELHQFLNPEVKHISRGTAVADVLKLYTDLKESLKQTMAKSPGRICLTSDCWTSITSEGYLCLTAHFVDDKWKLNSKILSFCKMIPPHSGFELYRKIYNCLIEWGIDKKVFSITLDNASANDNMQDILKEKLLLAKSLVCGGEFFHIRCCAHILNLIVQEGLKVVGDALQKIRESIKYVKASEARMIMFRQCVDEIGGVDTSMGLRLDVPTRWNSTYAMLRSAIKYRDVFATLALNDRNYKHLPTSEEWRRANEMCSFLKPFDVITKLFSGTSYPTSNMYFMQISRIEVLLKEKCRSDDNLIQNMASSMKVKFDKYWSDYSVILALATIFDPRFKFDLIRFSYSMLDPGTCSEKIATIKSKLYSIYGDYNNGSSSSSRANIGIATSYAKQPTLVDKDATPMEREKEIGGSESSEVFDDAFDIYMDFAYQDSDLVGKSELDLYLEEARLDPKIFKELDVLNYWKNNYHRFPHLSRMACDILSILITTVASESAFSIGSRVLTKYRSSLLPDNVQALICARNWLLGFKCLDGEVENDEEANAKEDLFSLSTKDSNNIDDTNAS